MAELPQARRMRRFRDSDGTEYDELLDGTLRRRLKAGDKSPIPSPQTLKSIEAKRGLLKEIDPAALARARGTQRRRRCTRCSNSNCDGCSGGRRKGKRR